jgi:hypothetical protein
MTINNHSFQLKHPQRSFNDVFADMKSILERLAPEEYPITKTNVGVLEITRCKYCDTITTMWGECNHAPDCPWVEARKLLEELK